ncbi:hypothetical protein FHS76_004191 [Ochrobactrum daejeonense]|uniref:Uncharacterized protein n=1 Tax=Brucella daejeonensis TaxID=659015 RepID=A0A7W9B132_9HYPH|nr:hypothetical protein [Brucella daejeonensis]
MSLNAVPVAKNDGVQFPPRPPQGPVDFAAVRKDVMSRFPKVRAELAK